MNFTQALKMAIKCIRTNKARSFLTMLGVIIGVGSVISAVAYAQGSTKSMTDMIRELGTNTLTVTIFNRGSNRNVGYSDLVQFGDANPEYFEMLAPTVSANVTAKNEGENRSTPLIGTSPEYKDINNIDIGYGRFLLDLDVKLRNNVAVVGSTVANELYGGENPVGGYIKINGYRFRIVGLLAETQSGRAGSSDDRIIIPVSVAQRLSRSESITNFTILVSESAAVSDAISLLSGYLTAALRDSNQFRIMNPEEILTTLDELTQTQMLMLGGIASISLLVGGIGIMNIMLVSVTERTREIGIRKAIGAKRRSVMLQFLIEAVILTGIGGLIGVAAAFAAIRFVIGTIVPPVYSLSWTGVSFGISLATGVLFGIFPAWKASSLNPIDALRTQ
ncbi:MAG: ABC transporter permease [Clostridiales bacterium]|jgi:putative ABC transport system permease protein|nr:ABC transporter permease [Clostridiales bacterium]